MLCVHILKMLPLVKKVYILLWFVLASEFTPNTLCLNNMLLYKLPILCTKCKLKKKKRKLHFVYAKQDSKLPADFIWKGPIYSLNA